MIRQRATVNVVCGLILCGMMTGCSDSSSPTEPTGGPSAPSAPQVVDRTFTLAPNQIASVNDGTLDLIFRGVIKDERCGAAANCVAGMVLEAVLEFDVIQRSNGFTFSSRTQAGTWTGKLIGANGYNVTIEHLAPYPIGRAADEIKPADYRVTIRITSAPTSAAN
jgi:hypothetical protein